MDHPVVGSVSRKGFTLIDLLISIAIIGILGMLVVPQYQTYITDAKLKGAATELVSALEYAKSLSVRYQRPFQVRVFRYDYSDLKANQFTVKDTETSFDSGIHLDAEPPLYSYHRVFNPLDKKPYIIDFDDIQLPLEGIIEPRREYKGVNITYVPGGGTEGIIAFYPDGHSSSSNGTIVLRHGGSEKTITISGITGRVHVQ